MNATLTRSYSRQLRTNKRIEPIKSNNDRTFKKSKSNVNLSQTNTSMNVHTKKAMNDIENISKQFKAKRRNRYQIEYESEYNKQFSIPRSIPQAIKE